jgi:hypothetical protein
MPRPSPGKTPLFHIIPIEKLATVIEHGLLCARAAEELFGDQEAYDAAHASLKQRRWEREVPVAAGGVMADYVPFYFAPRSPMLFSIKCGNTNYGANGRGQPGMLHLVTRLETLALARPNEWCFLDQHVSREWGQFGDTLDELDQRIDFDVMPLRIWKDPVIRDARQAEFLVSGVVPWDYVEVITAISDDVVTEVNAIIAAAAPQHRPMVVARPPGHYPESAFPHGHYY